MEAGGRALILVLMGVSGSGKSTVAATLVGRLGWPFLEGDDLHPAANIAAMRAGRPLTDADRWPWLDRIRGWIEAREAASEDGIVTCSALRRRYRDVLTRDGSDAQVRFVYLAGRRPELLARLRDRTGHFMPAALLDSQLAELEPPGPDEAALTVDVGPSAAAQAERIVEWLGRAA